MRVVPRAVIASPSKHKASFHFGQRLHQPGEFAAVLSVRRAVKGAAFCLHYRQVEAGGRSRFGLIVPKRLARKASVRNSIKRQGREAFRLMAMRLPPFELVLRLIQPAAAVARARDDDQRRKWRGEIESLLMRLPPGSS